MKRYSTLLQSKINISLVLFGSLSAAFAVLWYWKFHSLPLMQPDSPSYINFSPIRTVGYPFLLWVIQGIFGTLNVMPIIHLFFLVLSSTYLASVFYSITESYMLACLLIVGIMINPIYHYAFNIMTEPVSIALMMTFMGVAIRLFQEHSLKKLVLLSIITGFCILIRPAHYAYGPVLLVIVLAITPFSKFRFSQMITASLAPLIFLIFFGCVGQYWKNGIFRLEAMGPFNMIGKVSFIADKDIPGRYPPFLKEVVEFSIPVHAYIDKAPNLLIRYWLSAPYYDYFRYQYLSEISKRVFMNDDIYKESSWNLIKACPGSYLKDVWINFCALWQLWDLLTTGERASIKEFLDSHPPAPFIPPTWYPSTINFSFKEHPVFIWGIRATLLGICFSGLMMILGSFIALVRRKTLHPLMLSGAMAALITQGHFLLTALVQAGLPRYSFALWPAIVLVGIIMLEMGRQRWKGSWS